MWPYHNAYWTNSCTPSSPAWSSFLWQELWLKPEGKQKKWQIWFYNDPTEVLVVIFTKFTSSVMILWLWAMTARSCHPTYIMVLDICQALDQGGDPGKVLYVPARNGPLPHSTKVAKNIPNHVFANMGPPSTPKLNPLITTSVSERPTSSPTKSRTYWKPPWTTWSMPAVVSETALTLTWRPRIVLLYLFLLFEVKHPSNFFLFKMFFFIIFLAYLIPCLKSFDKESEISFIN